MIIYVGGYIADTLIVSDDRGYYDAIVSVPEVPGMEYKLEGGLEYQLSSERLHFVVEET